jgi:hypothetical protein
MSDDEEEEEAADEPALPQSASKPVSFGWSLSNGVWNLTQT